MSLKAQWIALVAIALTGCPSDRRADPTLRGTSLDVPPSMRTTPPPVVATVTGLRGPESVLHDPEQDVYFISNLNGGLLEHDDNGFITRIDAKSMAVELKWIEGGRNGVRLDAPKGMAIVGETLFVSDIAGVRKFDRRSGSPLGTIILPGATLINDLATDGSAVYVSDTGVRPGPGSTFYSTGTDAIWMIRSGRAEEIAGTTALRQPNGLDVVHGTLRFVTFRGGELYELRDGEPHPLAQLPEGQLDGLVHLKDGDVLVTSWEGEGVYRGSPERDFVPILTGIGAPADLGYDAARNRILVPRSASNEVTIHALDERQ